MKKHILALVLGTVVILLSCVFVSAEAIMSLTKHIDKPEEEQVEIVPMTVNIEIEKLDNFIDENINNYSLEELEVLIEEKEAITINAQGLIGTAQALGWPDNSDPIIAAQAELWNANLAIEVYEEAYQLELEELEKAKWDEKALRYPAATQIWLYMKDLGWSDYVCAGIMGNLMTEVGGQTLNLKPLLDVNGFYGMCMWSKKYSPNVIGKDLEGQCDYLRDTIQKEINTFGKIYHRGFNYNSFLNLDSERDAALAFAKCYERCGTGMYITRQDNATKAYNYFVNN